MSSSERKIKGRYNPMFFQLVQNFVFLLFFLSTFSLSAQVDTVYETGSAAGGSPRSAEEDRREELSWSLKNS